MKNDFNIVETLSKHLFWDVDALQLNSKEHSNYIIKKVLLYGFYSDWKEIHKYYGIEKIINTALNMRELDKKTASFLSAISGKQKTEFLCYNTEQSIQKHWNF